MRDVEETALAFDRAARRAGVQYAFMGGIAVLAWGQPRATADVDTLLAISRSEIVPFVAALAAEGLTVSPGDLHAAFEDQSHVTIFDERSGFHVDVKLATSQEELEELRHAREIPFHAGHLRIVAPEETIVFKLRFGSPQDLQDARSVVIRQEGRLDMGRLRSLAAKLGVTDTLDELLAST